MSLSIEVAAELWNPIELLKLTRAFAFLSRLSKEAAIH